MWEWPSACGLAAFGSNPRNASSRIFPPDAAVAAAELSGQYSIAKNSLTRVLLKRTGQDTGKIHTKELENIDCCEEEVLQQGNE